MRTVTLIASLLIGAVAGWYLYGLEAGTVGLSVIIGGIIAVVLTWLSRAVLKKVSD